MMNRQIIAKSNRNPIRVLFIFHECLWQDFIGKKEPVAWYEGVLAHYCGNEVCVALAFGNSGSRAYDPSCELDPTWNSSITYFPLDVNLGYGAIGGEWNLARTALLGVIDEFKPDIIHCFGSEWPYGAIAENVDIPVVIHMMGFLNIYYSSIDMANGRTFEESVRHALWRKLPFGKRNHNAAKTKCEEYAAFERSVMKANRYFMGRTNWDRNIVKHYSPGSRYFNVSECIHYPFMRDASSWRYHFDGNLKLLTVSSADGRKGIEIILRTAKLLKELVGIDFEWHIAGNKEFFDHFERRCGICHDDVNIRLLGILEAESVADELKSADLFIHPSIIDNSPRTICEAQLIGCPVIASNVGGVPQLVDNGVTGFLYPYNEPHTLAFLISDLMEQRDTLTEVSETASRIARERHDPARIASQIFNIYREVLSIHEE